MRKVLGSFTIILISAIAAFSQQEPPVMVGYAVITPVTGPTNTMVVFETFGFRRGGETTQAGVLPAAALTTNSILFVSASGRLNRNLGVALVNPNTTGANVTLTLRREDGTQLATTTLTVGALQHRAEFVTQLFANQPSVPSDFTGTLAITSTAPIAVMGLRFRGLNFSTLPVTNISAGTTVPIISTGVGGAGSVILPQVAAGGGWATQIVVGNVGTTSLTVRVDLFRQDGTPLSTSLNGTTAATFNNIVIPPGGVTSLAPRNSVGDDDF